VLKVHMMEYRFDELDLREEPASLDRTRTAIDNTGAQPAQEGADATTNHACTRICCV
jgi:hypothetical protein